MLLDDGGEQKFYEEAIMDNPQNEWLKVMQEEMKSLHQSVTYKLVYLPKCKRELKKWVYELKTEENNSRLKYKVILLMKASVKRKVLAFEKKSPVVKMSSIQIMLGLAEILKLDVEKLDVSTAFLHGDLEEVIYMEKLEEFKVKGKECLLKKSLYGLKHASRQWYKKFDLFMIYRGYRRTNFDHCVFVNVTP